MCATRSERTGFWHVRDGLVTLGDTSLFSYELRRRSDTILGTHARLVPRLSARISVRVPTNGTPALNHGPTEFGSYARLLPRSQGDMV